LITLRQLTEREEAHRHAGAEFPLRPPPEQDKAGKRDEADEKQHHGQSVPDEAKAISIVKNLDGHEGTPGIMVASTGSAQRQASTWKRQDAVKGSPRIPGGAPWRGLDAILMLHQPILTLP
jgi:hypothetical protein